jgi:hypothetical protein
MPPEKSDFEAAVASATKRLEHGDFMGAVARLDKAKQIVLEEHARARAAATSEPER